jgi:hypothetical protein
MVNLPPPFTLDHLKGSGVYKGVSFRYAVPRGPTLNSRPLRILLSQHGTRVERRDTGAEDYLSFPLQYDDPKRYDLVVIAPDFPSVEEVGEDRLNGYNFYRFDGEGLPWIRGLIRDYLPGFFAQRSSVLAGRTIKYGRFYFFGHSRGGQAVHMYVMKYGGADIYSAASCGCELFQRNQYLRMPPSKKIPPDYLDRLDNLVETNFVSIIGTQDIARRIQSIRGFIVREIGERVTHANLCKLLPDPPVPLLKPGTKLAFEDFPGREVTRKAPLYKDVGFAFMWNAGARHRGVENYPKAREYLFGNRPAKPLPPLLRATSGLRSVYHNRMRRAEAWSELDRHAEELEEIGPG